ncbi:Thiosulfate sulfurtransferase [Nitrosococcus oceani ATCC 19707]|uniref:Thiosulfate sulfurtransferase n=2 Tax=Nitrosococcus oceani TaxID=1229 RepID=Q3JEM2_NITOC|nr:rhodanese-like domain-containing protein [Nitrosococcus oceani]ABA56724.1 Thiosulfate sulfurtransferase [Nitrosococcus oceani ATCC 19707]KFI20860.1 thiosulfate sulfurtransferase [Nitrosococcus oceani C-27]GEM21614.1 sulfurtransferase [Nitrosococcus oceani]
MAMFSLLLQPDELVRRLDEKNLLLIDLGSEESYLARHVPGAVHLDYTHIVAARPPVMGLLPDEHRLSRVLSQLGFTPESHVVAYDAEGNGRASRLLWTLEELGHKHFSLLDGGLKAWLVEECPVKEGRESRQPSHFHGRYQGHQAADKEYILAHLLDPKVVILDARSPAEYHGEYVRAQRGGHIPGAVNFEWTQAIDQERNLRFKPMDELRSSLEALGITPDKEVICYCQTHHRSAHTCMVLKYLGYPKIKGYPGSWSEWGNAPDTPIKV